MGNSWETAPRKAKASHPNWLTRLKLPRQGSNLDSSDPESDVLSLGCIPHPVAVGEGGGEAVEKLWHCVLAPLATVLE